MSTCLGACDVYAGTCVYVCMCVSVHERGGKRGYIWSFVIRFMCVYEDAICVVHICEVAHVHARACMCICMCVLVHVEARVNFHSCSSRYHYHIF